MTHPDRSCPRSCPHSRFHTRSRSQRTNLAVGSLRKNRDARQSLFDCDLMTYCDRFGLVLPVGLAFALTFGGFLSLRAPASWIERLMYAGQEAAQQVDVKQLSVRKSRT